jgi:putative aldouronate transport system permease protein
VDDAPIDLISARIDLAVRFGRLADPNQQPLQVYLRQLIENYQKLYDESPVVLSYSADSLAYAIIVCSIIPVLVIYPYIQKYFAKGVNVGGVKG